MRRLLPYSSGTGLSSRDDFVGCDDCDSSADPEIPGNSALKGTTWPTNPMPFPSPTTPNQSQSNYPAGSRNVSIDTRRKMAAPSLGFSDEWTSGKCQQIKERLAADFTRWEADNAKFEEQFERVVKTLQTEGAREEAPVSRL